MEFKSYNTIENAYPKYIEHIKELKCFDDNDEWIATEKIHGANFSALTDGNNLSWCRRTGILTENEKFYNHERETKSIEDSIKILFAKIKEVMPNLIQLQVFGELFGGVYPHNDVAKVIGVSKVQDGIYYHPNIQFMIFDALYTTSQPNEKKYFDYDVLIKFLGNTSLKFCPILKRGKLDDLMKLDPYFQTIIPNLFGLPKIENNFAEGYVLKPTKTIYLPNGSRLALKLKRSNLSEVITNSEEAKNSTKNSKIRDLVFSYLNENRLASVKSKLTDQERTNEKLMIDKLVDDAWVDIKKDHTIQFDIPGLSKIMKKYCEKFFEKKL